MPRARDRGRPAGLTLIEMMVVLVIVGALGAIALPRFRAGADGRAVRGARAEVLAALSTARSVAVGRARLAAFRIDTASGGILVLVAGDTVLRRDLRQAYGVRIRSARDSIAYSPTGRGYGGSNVSLFLSRGAAADTIIVSRLGRVRH